MREHKLFSLCYQWLFLSDSVTLFKTLNSQSSWCPSRTGHSSACSAEEEMKEIDFSRQQDSSGVAVSHVIRLQLLWVSCVVFFAANSCNLVEWERMAVSSGLGIVQWKTPTDWLLWWAGRRFVQPGSWVWQKLLWSGSKTWPVLPYSWADRPLARGDGTVRCWAWLRVSHSVVGTGGSEALN